MHAVRPCPKCTVPKFSVSARCQTSRVARPVRALNVVTMESACNSINAELTKNSFALTMKLITFLIKSQLPQNLSVNSSPPPAPFVRLVPFQVFDAFEPFHEQERKKTRLIRRLELPRREVRTMPVGTKPCEHDPFSLDLCVTSLPEEEHRKNGTEWDSNPRP